MDKSKPQRLAALTSDAAWIVDGDGRIVFWNSAAEQLTGHKPEAVLGQPCQGVLALCHTCLLRHLCDGPQPQDRDARTARLRNADGSERLVVLNTIVLSENEAGEQYNALHIAYPISETTAGLRLHLLGPVAVMRPDGTWVDNPSWRRTKVRALLAILAANAGQPVHRETLLDLLWSDFDPATGLANLNSTVSDLRRCLANSPGGRPRINYVTYKGSQYALSWSPADWLDTQAFEEGIRQARTAAVAADRMAAYRQALDLYRDDYLADVVLAFHDDFYLREQWRLKELYLTAMEECAALEERLGQASAARELYARILSREPWRESAARRLITLLLGSGDRPAAIALYRKLAAALKSELNTQPAPETTRLINGVMPGRAGLA
jgi:PAS domain S-box-containing protein